MNPKTTTALLGLLSVMLCCSAPAQEDAGSGALSLPAIVQAMEKAQAEVRPRSPYQVFREYRLFGANSPSADSTVVAEISFSPPDRLNYNVQRSSGSSRGGQVVRRILDHEVEATVKGNQPRTHGVTSNNYDFTYRGETVLDGQPCYLLGLKPKRKEKDLISGEAWVDKHSLLVRRIDGEIAKTPSWWLKRVRVKLAFADVDGTWLQTSMEVVADVRIFGPHTLTSRILDYRASDVLASKMLAPSGMRSGDRKHKGRSYLMYGSITR
jgi:outer membrane lipoprotein-sorting protein